MELSDVIQSRYSVRSYKKDPVEEDKLEHVLEAARLAPTADNRQTFQLILVHTAGREEELKRIYGRDWFVQAPLVICVCAVAAGAWVRADDNRNYCIVDAAIVMDHLILTAADLGLGTCWIAAFHPSAAREVLGLPDSVEPVAFTPLGYPTGEPRPKRRKPLADIIRYERWE